MEEKNMKCPNCGKELKDGAKFCAECGTKIEVSAKKEVVFCTECGAENDKDANICYGCGNNLKAKPASQTSAVGSYVQPQQQPQSQTQLYTSGNNGNIFENCGLYLKKFAKIFGWAGAIAIPIILFIFGMSINDTLSYYMGYDQNWGIVLSLILCAVLGILILIFFMRIYAVGKIVDDISEIKKTICDKNTLEEILKTSKEIKKDKDNLQSKKK